MSKQATGSLNYSMIGRVTADVLIWDRAKLARCWKQSISTKAGPTHTLGSEQSGAGIYCA
jgi:hypothetical protein